MASADGNIPAGEANNKNLMDTRCAPLPPPGTAEHGSRLSQQEHNLSPPQHQPQQQVSEPVDYSSFAGFDLLNSALELHVSSSNDNTPQNNKNRMLSASATNTSTSSTRTSTTDATKAVAAAPPPLLPNHTRTRPTGHEPSSVFLVPSQNRSVVVGGGMLEQQQQHPMSTIHHLDTAEQARNLSTDRSNGTDPLTMIMAMTTTTTASNGKDPIASAAQTSLQAAAASRTALIGSSEITQIKQQQQQQQQQQEENDSASLPLQKQQQQQPPPPNPPSPPPPDDDDDDNTHHTLSKQPQRQPQRPPGKRPSPWREPRVDHQLPPPAKEVQHPHTPTTSAVVRDHKLISMQRRQARQRQRQYRKFTSDAVTVHIPLHITADLAVPLQRTRPKRIQALYAQFPVLQQQSTTTPLESSTANAGRRDLTDNGMTQAEVDDDDDDDNDDDLATKTTSRRPKKKKPVLKHVPQPHEYSNVIDYLEAKYVQGIMVGVGEDAIYQSDNNNNNTDASHGGGDHDDDEGGGSVYSDTSFLDDSGLQRTVAEQVLGQTTTTKLELQHNDDSDGDDHAFFVNVGTLEVEENEMTQQAYDPLQDTNNAKKAFDKKPRKRKKQSDGEPQDAVPKKAKTNGKATASSKSLIKVESPKQQKKKVQPVKNNTSASNNNNKTSKPAAPASPEKKNSVKKVKDAAVLKLQKIAEARKKKADVLYAQVVELINQSTDEELPRKPKAETTRVTITVPPDRKPGDSITFVNPHHANQKLKCKIPHNIKANGTFKVSVPKPAEEYDPDKDYNRLGRTFYDTLEHYARLYDEWCEAEGDYRKVAPPLDDDEEEEFNPHQVKRQKFDQLADEFPNDSLKTPVDKAYLQKILRRARQNKHKRELNLARQRQQQQQEQSAGEGGDDEENDEDGSSDDADDNDNDNNNESDGAEPSRKKIKVEGGGGGSNKRRIPRKMALIPNLSLDFMTKTFDPRDF